MAKRFKITGFARFLLVMTILAPLAYIGASYYNGQDGIQNFKDLIGISDHASPKENTDHIKSINAAPEEDTDLAKRVQALQSENEALRRQLNEKDQEIKQLRIQVDRLRK